MSVVPTPLSRHPANALPSPRREMSVEVLALGVSLYFTAICNITVWRHVLAEREWSDPRTWALVASLSVAVTAAQALLMLAVATRRNAHWLFGSLIVVSALAGHYIRTYAVFLDPGMLRNALHTDTKEARELVSFDLLWQLVWQAALPIWLLSRVSLRAHPWRRALLRRGAALLGAAIAFVAALLPIFRDAAALARNHREWRYLVTPSNVVYSLVKVASADTKLAAAPRQPIGVDAHLGPSWQGRQRPALLVIVVGETARAANWGLSGYRRQTTPELAQLDVINFRDVRACGTNTEVSVPCMFSPWGRRAYDASRIQASESLLHVLDRAQLRPLWRDNQAGCKGVCSGIESYQSQPDSAPDLCSGDRCLDEVLLRDLDSVAGDARTSRVVVLHQLGSHGPAYHKRYPDAFRRFEPTCETSELRKCTPQQIVNTYDNTILYTDHVVAQTIRLLKRLDRTHDTALVYVSDHGESLGERNLYLHGLPYPIAPREQTQVPMVAWLSPGFERSFGIDGACLRQVAQRPASHDHLFHSVLGLLDVRTSVYDADYDLTKTCRSG